jgi:hypothetical protein
MIHTCQVTLQYQALEWGTIHALGQKSHNDARF